MPIDLELVKIDKLDNEMEYDEEDNYKERSKEMTIDEILDAIPIGWFHYRLLFICGIAFAADAMEVSLLSFIGTCAGNQWNLHDKQKASISSFVFAGELIGSIFWGRIADKYGRKQCFTAGCLVISIAGVLSAISPSYVWLLIFRALVGFGIGCVTVPFDILAEFLPKSLRGKYLLYIEYFWTFGTLLVNGIAWMALSSNGWRFLVYITAIPVTVSLLISILCLPESPRWLLSQGRRKEAEDILYRIAVLRDNPLIGAFHIKRDDEKVINTTGFMDLIRTPAMRRISIPLTGIWFCFGFSYLGLILLVSRIYTTTSTSSIPNQSNQSFSSSTTSHQDVCSFDYRSIFINSIAEILGVAIASCVIDIFGRIRTQTSLYLVSSILMISMGFRISSEGVAIISWICRATVMAAVCITWVATPELFSTDLRGTGHAVCNGIARVGAFIAPYFTISSLSPFIVGLGIAFVNVIAAFSSCILPETSDKELDEDIVKSEDSIHNESSHVSIMNLSKNVNSYAKVATTTSPIHREARVHVHNNYK